MHENEALFYENIAFDHAQMMRVLSELLTRYSFLDLSYLGTSILGVPIPILTVGTGHREILYVGAHHGMEWITSLVLCRFLAELCKSVEEEREVFRTSLPILLETCKLSIIPMLNPDGVSYQIHGIDQENPLRERLFRLNPCGEDFSKWQANARGVDLNHNYNAGFWEYKRLEAEHGIVEGAPTRYSGEHPESEPEVSALCNWIGFHDSLCGILTLHTRGEEIYYRNGESCAPRAPAIARRIAELTGYRIAKTDGLASYGGLTDWCALEGRIPCFTLECGYGENPLPISDHTEIYSRLRRLFYTFPTLV